MPGHCISCVNTVSLSEIVWEDSMTATGTKGASATARKDRSNDSREPSERRKPPVQQQYLESAPAAGAHAAAHLTNEDATPGSGALTSHAHRSGKEVDGGAG
jgi:hypothetical protein